MTGAQVVVQTLLEQGVELVFGYPGANVLPLYEALRERRGQIRHVLSCHEQGAVHASDGYARASGKTGVVLATSGPGATNLVTGIAAAYMDSIPLVAITGNVPLRQLGRDCFQEIDIAGVTMPITKHNYIIKDTSELEPTLKKAFCLAQSGRRGPVLVDIPMDISTAQVEYRALPVPVPQSPTFHCSHPVNTFMDYICAHERPLLLLGGGVIAAGAEQEALALAELLDLPVCSTLMGLGGISGLHRSFLGMTGIHGTKAANRAVAECDLLIAVGTRFNERVAQDRERFAPRAHILHLDIDNSEIEKNVRADRFLVGDAKKALGVLLLQQADRSFTPWRKQAVSWKTGPEEGFPHEILRALWRHRGEEDLLVTDVGQHQMWAARSYPVERPRTFITSGGLGAMGFGMGAAVGACLACPGAGVTLVTGDGSFHMDFGELATAVTENLPLRVFVFNNQTLGLVRVLQERAYGAPYAVEPRRRTDLVLLAEAMGARGLRLQEGDCVDQVVRQAFETGGPCVVDCRIERETV